jgi:dienelactone hydrolase
MKKIFLILFCIPFLVVAQQKVPLNHSVYDSWESIGEKYISNNGAIVVYTINVQEGDGRLVIQKTSGEILQTVPRGYNATISEDDKFIVFKIKPTFKETRDAKIAKKKADDLPKDSLGIYDIAKNKLEKIERVKSYKMPEKAGGWLAYLLHKSATEGIRTPEPEIPLDSNILTKQLEDKIAYSTKLIDSLNKTLNKLQVEGFTSFAPKRDTTKRKTVTTNKDQVIEEGTSLKLVNLTTGKKYTYQLVNDYFFSKNGEALTIEYTKSNTKNTTYNHITYTWLSNLKVDTILFRYKEAKNFTFSDNGTQLAFAASFDTTKNEQKEFKIYLFAKSETDGNVIVKNAIDIAKINTPKNWRINENTPLSFSKSGNRLFFGTSPILPVKDTSLPEFERVSVDVWNYKDEDLMTVQLKQVDAKLRRGFTAMYDDTKGITTQLGNDNFRVVRTTLEGDGKYFYTESDSGYRVAAQWQGFTYKDVFMLNSFTNETKKIATKVRANIYPSYTGKYLLMYDEEKKQYSCYNAETNTTIPVAKDIPYPLYDEENDMPDAPNNYGIVKWMEEDKYVLIYDKYDLWKVDPLGKQKSICATLGRKDKMQCRYISLDNDEKFISDTTKLLLRTFSEIDKTINYWELDELKGYTDALAGMSIVVGMSNILSFPSGNVNLFAKAKKANKYFHSFENYKLSPVLSSSSTFLYETNPQQSSYNWGTAELFKWKAYTGKLTEGIVYKPENFDSTKKYPMIVYFYERNNQTLHNYRAPSPTASALNIPYFVSNGYVVFVPDIWYKTGYPGQSAYDYIVSGTRALVKKGFIDSTKIGLQGQSWGGYQIAYLITQTSLYKAAWAGAPVANMFSAYGGIRWGTGLNRQFQYEHSQSRIGATPWQKPELYIKNSPLFHLPKVTTPLVIMHNDADDAVPWYQGIELFTAMRRLNKKVWMLNYNGEAHNLIERKNRKDIQQKQAEFFDYMLNGAAPAKWISEGVPAVMKGRVGN